MATCNEVYRQAAWYWGCEPDDVCPKAWTLLTTGAASPQAPGLGCGEGRDLMALVRQSPGVTGAGPSIAVPQPPWPPDRAQVRTSSGRTSKT